MKNHVRGKTMTIVTYIQSITIYNSIPFQGTINQPSTNHQFRTDLLTRELKKVVQGEPPLVFTVDCGEIHMVFE